jgi:hypothetical protein
VLADESGFKNYVDVNLQKRIVVRPKDFAEFSHRLWNDIASCLEAGSQFEGDWGYISGSSNRIVLHVSAQADPLPKIGKRAIVLE